LTDFFVNCTILADPDPGSGAFLAPGSGMNNPNHISAESIETIFWVKRLKFFDAEPGLKKFAIRIRDGKNSNPGPGINIPDPQHCCAQDEMGLCFFATVQLFFTESS
jgi:hypothetical protein